MRLFLFLLFAAALTGCNSAPEGSTTHFSGNAMTIDYRITIAGALSHDQQQIIQGIVSGTFAEINTVYNKWNPNSEISRLNKLKAGEVSPISAQLEAFLHQVDEIVQISKGRFDPTIEPLQQLWKQKLALGSIPSDAEIQNVMPAVGWHKIHFNHGQFSKDHDLTSLDLGGIAKGLCVDLLVERLNRAGYPDLFVEWGGEIRASGQHPDKRPWHIFISRFGDTNPDNAIAHIDLHDQAIATSGDYLQNWRIERDGKTIIYFHILNPLTGYPLVATADSIASASVVAPTCVLADGLATVAMLFATPAEAHAWAAEVQAKHPQASFWIASKKVVGSQ